MKTTKRISAVLLIMLVLAVAYLVIATQGYAWREGAIDDSDSSDSKRPSVELPVDLLALDWDSEAKPDWPVAGLMAELCEVAYKSPVTVEATFKRLGFHDWQTVVDGSMVGYVLIHNQTAVVVLRGSDDRNDWLVNLTSMTSRTSNGRIHRGFSDAYRPLQPQVETILRNNSIKNVWISGHSLGGALALVAANDLLLDDSIEIKGVVTFGQPAVAKSDLANYLDQALLGRYARFVNHDDIVPRIPFTFQPCGRLVWFTETGLKRSPFKRLTVGARSSDRGGLSDEASDVQEVPMMSEAEFQQWLKGQANNQPKQLSDGTVVYGTSIRHFDDHSMKQYQREIDQLLKIKVGRSTK